MNSSTFDTVVGVLVAQFDVESSRVTPDTRLQALGLDSLALMEFVFAIEDEFGLRIPEDRLDPRQASLTVADLCTAIDDALAQRASSSAAP